MTINDSGKQSENGGATDQQSGLAYLGFLRFILASNVVLFHLWTTVAPDAGRHSVVGFFCISGFLITKISRENYKSRPFAFLENRFLRIYPAYLFACLFGYIISRMYPDVAAGPFVHTELPVSLHQWVTQLTIFSISAFNPNRLVPPAWTLAIELYFYLVVGLITHRSKRLTIVCLLASLAVAFLSIFHVITLQFYFSPYADGCFFFAGSLAYFLSQEWKMPSWTVGLAGATYAICTYGLPNLMQLSDYAGPLPNLYLLISLGAVCVLLVGTKSLHIPHGKLSALAGYMGRLSYPIFLLHWTVAMPFSVLLGTHNGPVFFASYAALLILSALVVQVIDKPIEHLRRKIRHRKSA